MRINPTAEVLLQFVRSGMIVILFALACLFGLALVGVGYQTTNASSGALLAEAALYLAATFACLGYALWGSREWLRWVLLGVAALPVVGLVATILVSAGNG